MMRGESIPRRSVSSESTCSDNRTALVLTGGGARAAYQVGVLQAISELLPTGTVNPFPIICGTSAGAVNAVSLACQAENFRAAVDSLVEVWRSFHADQVYRSDSLGLAATGVRWLSSVLLGRLMHGGTRSLLDNAPLADLLRQLDFPGIDRAIANGHLRAVSITASGYTSGQSVSFFQARADVETWQRAQRKGARVRLGIEHLLASSAIPFIFPPVKIHREFFGDGSMRQVAPISPAVHLGATKVLVIGAGRVQEPDVRIHQITPPSLAQIAGHALAAIFLDTLAVDIERMERINDTLGRLGPEVLEQAGIPLRPIRSLVISPSERLDALAAQHARSLPRSVRFLLSRIGAMNRRGGALTSYLLFEQPYTRALVDLGYRNTMSRCDEVRAFLDL